MLLDNENRPPWNTREGISLAPGIITDQSVPFCQSLGGVSLSATHPLQPRWLRINAGILFGVVALVALANVYLGFPYNLFAPKCNGPSGSSPCFGCTCSPTPPWKPPVMTFVQVYPILSALLILASVFVAVVGFVLARAGERALNPLIPFLPIITVTLIALVAIVFWWIALHVPGEYMLLPGS
jgi:hypothetical protein